MYSRGVFVLNSLWCHCYCCILLMKSIIKLWGLFCLPIRKKNIGLHPNLIPVWDKFPKKTIIFVFFFFFFVFGLFCFLFCFYFFNFNFFWWRRGGGGPCYLLPVQDYWYRQYLTNFYEITYLSKKCNWNLCRG